MNKLLLLPLIASTSLLAFQLCDTNIHLNSSYPHRFGMKFEKVFNTKLQTFEMKTKTEICKIYVNPKDWTVVKLTKANTQAIAPVTYPSSLLKMQFNFGELTYQERGQLKSNLKTHNFQEFSQTNMENSDILLQSKAAYKNETNGDLAYIETKCKQGSQKTQENCFTSFNLYSGKFLNKDRVQNKLFKINVEKEIENGQK